MSKINYDVKNGKIPAHYLDKLQEVLNETQKKGSSLHGAIPGNLRMTAHEKLDKLDNVIVLKPDIKDSKLSNKEKIKIERLAHRMVKRRGFRNKPELYSLKDDWIEKNKDRNRYFVACLRYEIQLRRGYK